DLVVWVRAEDVATSPVDLWPTQIGPAFAQATSDNRPTLIANAVNGYPAVRFDGVNDLMSIAISVSQPYTLFAVIRLNSGSGGVRHFAGSGSGGSAVSFGVEG